MDTIAEKEKKSSYRLYAVEIQDKEDLRALIAHLTQFFETIRFNDKTMIVEIWADSKLPRIP
jgi:hypothetical protein